MRREPRAPNRLRGWVEEDDTKLVRRRDELVRDFTRWLERRWTQGCT